MKYHMQIPIKALAERGGRFSERLFADKAGISRVSLRNLLSRDRNITLKSLETVAESLEREIHIIAINNDTDTDASTMAAAYKVMAQGFDSWKIHFLNLVDEFHRTLDPQLLIIPPPKEFPRPLKALLASIVLQLCEDVDIEAPFWAQKPYYLDSPWFVADMQSLKASALAESPLPFRRNNIFVLSNFLHRV